MTRSPFSDGPWAVFSVCTMKQIAIIPLLTLLLAGSLLAAPMDDEKLFTLPVAEIQLHPRMAELMNAALDQPQESTVLEALADIRNLKLTALSDRVIKLLDDPRPLVRLSAAKVVEELDLKQAAPTLLKWTAKPTDSNPWDPVQIDQALIADRLLARWKPWEARDVWAARITSASTPMVLRQSACTAAAKLPPDNFTPPLTQTLIATFENPANPLSLRLAAADAFHVVEKGDFDEVHFAKALQEKDPLIAARLLAHSDEHAPQPAEPLLVKLAVNPEPAVQAIALRRLLELDDSADIWPLAPVLVKSADPLVRLLAVKSTPIWHASDAVELLGPLLNDPHPDVRVEARTSLRTLAANPSLNPSIRAVAKKLLAQAVDEIGKNPAPHWRASEQAILLLGELDEKPAAVDLVKTVDHQRLEVRVASVIALRSLNVADTRAPLIKIYSRLVDLTEARKKKLPPSPKPEAYTKLTADNSVESQIIDEIGQTLGVWRVAEADPALRRVIPKLSAPTARARAAAIWALGLIHEGKPDAKLAATLMERAADLNPVMPEAEEVRLASIIATGRMKAPGQTESLHTRYASDGINIMCAARWAIMNITGKDLKPITLPPVVRQDAFISPEH